MAKAKKKSSKKKASKKKASKKKATRKKKGLSKLRSTSYELVWDAQRDNCIFGHHGKGLACPVMCGVTDAVTVFTDGKVFYVLSVNYDEGYACIEVVDGEEEPVAVCFADPKDVKKLFKGDLTEHSPVDIAERLAKECK